jgi:hypothetical protein
MGKQYVIIKETNQGDIMKKLLLAIPLSVMLSGNLPAKAESAIEIYSGFNNQVIGVISDNKYEDLNICNTYGQGGSSFASNSMFNSYSVNGGGAYGAYNSSGSNSPYFYYKGQRYNVSTNTSLANSISPDRLRGIVCK